MLRRHGGNEPKPFAATVFRALGIIAQSSTEARIYGCVWATFLRFFALGLPTLLERPKVPLRILRPVMENPEDLRPGKIRDELTAEAAEQFASLAELLRLRGHEPHKKSLTF